MARKHVDTKQELQLHVKIHYLIACWLAHRYSASSHGDPRAAMVAVSISKLLDQGRNDAGQIDSLGFVEQLFR